MARTDRRQIRSTATMAVMAAALVAVSCVGCAGSHGGAQTAPLASPRLIFEPTGQASAQNAACSPDGRWIAFESHLGVDEDTPASLWRVAAPAIK